MSIKKNLLLAAAALLSGWLCNAQEAGTPIFTDKFESKEKLAENWIARGTPKVADGKVELAASELTFRRDLPPEFFIEYNISLDHDMTKPGGFAGMLIGPYRFQIKPEGTSFLLWPDMNTKKAHGIYKKIDGFKLGDPVKIAVARTIDGEVATYFYFINGKLIGSFKASLPEKDKNGRFPMPFFTAWRVDKLTVDNFKLSEVKKPAGDAKTVPAPAK